MKRVVITEVTWASRGSDGGTWKLFPNWNWNKNKNYFKTETTTEI